MISFFFFFSSRRRHTRCSRDWSSDVCSSDLEGRLQGGLRHAAQLADGGDAVLGQRAGMHVADAEELLDRQRRQERSEEHTSELQSRLHLVCRLLLEKKKSDPDRVRLRLDAT